MVRRSPPGFSLLEVAIAVALVGVTVVTILGLLSVLSRRTAEARERRTALGLADAIVVELESQVAAEGWETIAAATVAGTDQSLRLVARRDGSAVRPWREIEPVAADQFFLIEVRRFRSGPLALQASGPVLPLRVTVSWPYRPGSPAGLAREMPAVERSRFEFTTAIDR